MINNRQAGRRRGRGGQQQRSQGGTPGRLDTGNRIDNRARGNAAQMLEKYKTLARDAQMQGDRVNVEYYLQFADHYFRVLAETRARIEENGGPVQRRIQGATLDEDDTEFEDEGERVVPVEQPRGGQNGYRTDANRQDGNRSDGPRQDSGRSENGRAENPRSENGRSENGRSENGRSDNGRSENARSDNGRQDGNRQDNPRNDNRADNPRADTARNDSARNDGLRNEGREQRPDARGENDRGYQRNGNRQNAETQNGASEERGTEDQNDRPRRTQNGNSQDEGGYERQREAPRGADDRYSRSEARREEPRSERSDDATPVSTEPVAPVQAEAIEPPRRGRGRPRRDAAVAAPAAAPDANDMADDNSFSADLLPPSLNVSAIVPNDSDGEPEKPRRRRGRPPIVRETDPVA